MSESINIENEIITSPSAIDSPSVSDLYDQREYYRYDIYGQRNFVWERKRKTMLICSLLKNVKPSIITANINGKTIEIVDGQQRLNTIFSFVNNEFKLSENTIITLAIGGEIKTYDISDMYYKDLPQELKLLLLSRNVRIEKYMDLTDSQANYIMRCLNNGKQHTNIERTRMEMFGSVGNFIEDMKNSDLFIRKINVNESSKNRLVIDGLIYSLIAWETGLEKEVTITNYQVIANKVKEEKLLTEDIKSEIRKTLEYMDSVFPAKVKFLDMKNFIPIYLVCSVHRDNIIGREMFNCLSDFYNNTPTNYNMGEGLRWSNIDIIKKKYEVLNKYIDSCKLEKLA